MGRLDEKLRLLLQWNMYYTKVNKASNTFECVDELVAGFNELRIKDKLIKEIVIKESAKKIQVINDVGKKGI